MVSYNLLGVNWFARMHYTTPLTYFVNSTVGLLSQFSFLGLAV
jgi:hypothetical protein